jgi:UDP-N-acetylmuramoylalanine--D-glutamate ligase
LRDPLRSRDAKVVAIGEATPMIERALDGAVPVEAVTTLQAAVRRAYELARAQGSGGVVLLAPACASFDMFRDYAERGRVFKQEVLRLQEEWNVTREQ